MNTFTTQNRVCIIFKPSGITIDTLLENIPIRYGDGEEWKKIRERIGRTKPARAPDVSEKKRKKNNGRPPDTIKDLLQRPPTKQQSKEVNKIQALLKVPTSIPSYPWKKNSCWLDASLELLHGTVSYDFGVFTGACQHLPPESPVILLYDMLKTRQTSDPLAKGLSSELGQQRDHLRKRLVELKEAKSVSSFEPLFVSPLIVYQYTY